MAVYFAGEPGASQAVDRDAIAVRDVSVAAGGRTILGPVSAAFAAGTVHALVGHNGSGKSTLVRVLAGQLRPSAGAATLGGKPVHAWAARALAREIAYLPQEPAAAAGFTVRDLVGLGRYCRHGPFGRFGAKDRAAVEAALEVTRTAGFADRDVASLSGGERQRAWIAMLVAQESRFLLLDEPTSALDIGHQLEVLALVRSLAEIRGVGIVMVLHDINMAARFADRLVALRGGRVIRSGTPDEILTADGLTEIFAVPMALAAGSARPLAYPL
ncbi:ABC transporter ATP-binding protein [Chthonobacter rhizosphaerae]|uniref:ABC transporter ATP-binding protein n=1 Tax=Chthonobacter rhizosphaerae TaxID=2735553 RepID=UPI0031B567FC